MQHDKENHRLLFEAWEQVALGAPETVPEDEVKTYYFIALDSLKRGLDNGMNTVAENPDISRAEWQKSIRKLAYARMLTGQLRKVYRELYPEHFEEDL